MVMSAGALSLSIFMSAAFTAQAHASQASYFGYSAIEHLWMAAGGSSYTASRAACIASHESGGNPSAISPTNDYGLFQIHDGGYAMLDPMANARRAVSMSADGHNWSAWTTAYLC